MALFHFSCFKNEYFFKNVNMMVIEVGIVVVETMDANGGSNGGSGDGSFNNVEVAVLSMMVARLEVMVVVAV